MEQPAKLAPSRFLELISSSTTAPSQSQCGMLGVSLGLSVLPVPALSGREFFGLSFAHRPQ
jgi:hypothetical protein